MKLKCLLLLVSCILLYSCKRRSCLSRIITVVNVTGYNQPHPIPDTAAKIIRFVNGSNFTQKADSSFANIYVKRSGNTYVGSAFGYDFSDISYEYMIVLLPSGVTHRVKDIRYGNEKYTVGAMGGGGSGNDPRVSCSYGYTLDERVISNGSDFYNKAGTHAEIDLH